ncbi:MAG: MFS transporter [Rikenellaceae bacterium]|nr:MFS transporter [Rikenellaceae bacterium]MBR2451595.1 MFS transporter [Rikenellaceae bacterium]
MSQEPKKSVADRLWTRDYIFLCLANFMMCFAFYLLVPTLPFYLEAEFDASKSIIGMVLSCYTIAVLAVRPFSGYIADTFQRKPVYLIAYFLFVSIFCGYLLAGTLTMLMIIRIAHGLAFGMITTTGNTLVVDVLPSSRRGEGLGYYGVVNNLAMSIGPMIGLFIADTGNFDMIFGCSLAMGVVGMVFATLAKVPRKIPNTANNVLSIDRFFLVKGLRACFTLLLLAIPYGMTTSFIAMYAKELGITANTGLFFTVMAVGLIVSRIGSGRRVDRGLVTKVITQGIIIATLGIIAEAMLGFAAGVDIRLGYVIYFLSAFLIGFGYGTMFPAYNTLFINLAPNSRRATASATYLTGWDVGIGLGMWFGGRVAENWGLATVYKIDIALALIAFVWFVSSAAPHFNRNKLR